MELIVAVFVMVLLASVLGTVVRVFFLRRLDVEIEEIGISVGPGFRLFSLGETPVYLRLIPLGGYTKLARKPYVREERDRTVTYHDDLSILQKVLIPFSGTVALFVLALILLGPVKALTHFVDGFQHLFLGAISPHEGAQVYIQAFQNVYETAPADALGILCTKLICLELLPVPMTPLGRAAAAFFKADEPDRFDSPEAHDAHEEDQLEQLEDKAANKLSCIGGLLLLGLMVSWATALIIHLANTL